MKTLATSFVFLFILVFSFACSGEKQDETQAEQMKTMESHEGHSMEEGEMMAEMVVDPVCSMKIKKEDAFATVEHEGKTYYFCMEADKVAFAENPKKYMKKTTEN
jgi:YHS domain-containing protein